MRFENDVVLITGAAGGIGACTANEFYKEGATLVLVDISKERLDETVAFYGFDISKVTLVTADVSKEEDVKNYVDVAVEKYGKIDVFYNNAGIESEWARLVDGSTDNFDKLISINLRGAYLGMKYVLKVMEKQGHGSIVNCSSSTGVSGTPNISTYSTTKFGVAGMTRSAAIEMAETGIRVNAVLPAYINTRMMRDVEMVVGGEDHHQDVNAGFTAVIPMKRFGDPIEVAVAVLFLASKEASFITGVLLPIDGGVLA